MKAASPLARDYRLWASLPPEVVALVIQTSSVRTHHSISTVGRPDFPAEVCHVCGCQERDACVDAIGECCSWSSHTRRLCTFCRGGVRRQR